MNSAMSTPRSTWSSFLLVALITCVSFATPGWAVGFQPVNPDELKMISEPKAPGAPAIILYREVNRDDRGLTGHEDVYFRIKILTEEGRKNADIEVPFFSGQGQINNLHARTIEPDGTIVNFSGRPFDKSIVKARGVRYMAKTFTLPNVQVGSILEYYYTLDFDQYFLSNSHWILSSDLFTKNAKFSLKPYERLGVRWNWYQLPARSGKPVQEANREIHLEAADIPAFQTEDYMPPENELRSRVDFIYSDDIADNEPAKYWKTIGKARNQLMESFINKKKAMEQAVAEIVSPADSPEVKLQKIYARVQQIRNTSYEREKTEQEQKRDKQKDANNVEAVWKKQYGDAGELTWLFLALTRAAGFDASGMVLADRSNYFFYPEIMDSQRLDANVVVIKLNGKDMFFQPGAAFTPFGMLPWYATAVHGLKLDKEGGSWLLTSTPESTDSSIQRKAQLKMTDTGDLEGKLTVTYTGLEASQRRVGQRLADNSDRKKFLEDEVKESIPAACEIELTNQPDWKSSSPALLAEYTMKVPGWVAGAGKRALLPVGLFAAPEKHLFDHAERIHPIYFEYPFQVSDDVSIDMPLGWQISTVPKPEKLDAKAITYVLEANNDRGTLHLSRVLNVDILLLPQANYANLRKIFQIVRTGDEQQVVLLPGGSTASN